jgi:flagellar biosynthetic protein FliO
VKVFLIIGLCLLSAGLLLASTPSKSENSMQAPASATVADPVPVQAAAPVAAAPMEEYSFPILKTIGGLGMVLSLIVAGYFGLKKLAPQYFAKYSSEKNLKVIETLSMGDRRSISIIQVANSRYLVGNTAQQINLLTTLPEAFSLVSEPESPQVEVKKESKKENKTPFRHLFEAEKSRPARQTGNALPEDLRTKMRQLREALERG